MKKIKFTFFINLLLSALCISSFVLIGFKQDLVYDDTNRENKNFILTNHGNITIDYIEGVLVEDNLIRVQNLEPYSVAITVGGESYTYDEFTFESSLDDVVYDMKYDYDEDVLYMNRTLYMVKGYYSLSLIAAVVLMVQTIYYVAFIASLKRTHDETQDNVYEKTLPERIKSVPGAFMAVILAIVGILFFIEIFISLEYFIYEMSDTLILLIAGGVSVVALAWSIYLCVFVRNFQFILGSNRLVVNQKGKELFNSSYDNLIVEERLVQYNNVSNRTLILKSKESLSRSVEVNSNFIGFKDYDSLVQRLHRVAKGLQKEDDHEVIQIDEGHFFAKRRVLQMIVLPILIFATIAIGLMSGFLIGNDSTVLIIATMIVVPLIVVTFLIFIINKQSKELMIKVDMGGITINDVLIEASSIKSITMKRPMIGAITPTSFKIKHASGKGNYLLLMMYKKDNFSEAYRRLYLRVNKYYGDVLNK